MRRFGKKQQNELSNFRPTRKVSNCHFVAVEEISGDGDSVKEEKGSAGGVFHRNKPNVELEASTFELLVKWVVWSDINIQEHITGLLFAYRSVSDPLSLLKILRGIHGDPKKQLPYAASVHVDLNRARRRILTILTQWVTHSFAHEIQVDRAVFGVLLEFLGESLELDQVNRFKLLFLRVAKRPQFNHAFVDSANDDLDRTTLLQSATFILQQTPFDVAYELSVIEWNYYRAIHPREFLHKNWQRENAAQLSPNLVALRKRFNQLSFWVATVLLLAADPLQQQKLYTHLTSISYELYKMRNYNAMGAINAGLGNISVERLHLDEHMPSKVIGHMERMQDVLEVAHNFKVYRELLAEAEDSHHVCLPYLPLHLRDLLHIHEREPDYSEQHKSDSGDRLISFPKIVALGNGIHSILHYQRFHWGDSDSPELAQLLQPLQFMTQDSLHEWSDKWKAESKKQSRPSIHRSDPSLASMSEVSTGNLLDVMGTKEQVRELGKARVIRGHVLLHLQLMGLTVVRPAPTDMNFRDLKRIVNRVSGWKDYKLFYGGLGGAVMLEVKQDEDMVGFISSSTTPTLIIEESGRYLKVSKNRSSRSYPSYSPNASPQVTPRDLGSHKSASERDGLSLSRKRNPIQAGTSYSETSEDESSVDKLQMTEFLGSLRGRVVTLDVQFGRISDVTSVLVPMAIPVSQFTILCMHLFGTAVNISITDGSETVTDLREGDKAWKNRLASASKHGKSVAVRISPKAELKAQASAIKIGNVNMAAIVSSDNIARSFESDSVMLSPTRPNNRKLSSDRKFSTERKLSTERPSPPASPQKSQTSSEEEGSDGERPITDMF